MAATMEALLKIKAVTEGEGGVMALARGMGSLKEGAEKASTGLKGALSSVGGMSSALGALVPLASGAGLVTLAKHAIDLGDDMNDMSQKTGVSVEMLSKFKQAAESSGTSVEGVTNAMVKLNKNMGTGNKATSEALKDLGISATDANGKLKSTDEVMLEVADKFQKMPDGANKTTAAIALFGKAGADMIPMLNGGRDSIESMTATMSTSFAKGADKFNDKMAALQAKILELGVGIGTALLPVLTALTDGISAIADGFQSLPGPLQTLIGGVVALAAAFVVLAPAIGAIASLGGVVGPAIAAITVALGGLLTFATSTLIPGLLAVFSGPVGWTVLAVAAVVAMVVAFREPIGKFLGWLGEQFGEVGPALLEVFNAIFVDPWINLWNDVLRKPVTAIWEWLKGVATTALTALYAIAYQIWVQPWINLWDNMLRKPVTAIWEWLKGVATTALTALYAIAYQIWVQPWINLWNDVLRKPVTAIWEWLKGVATTALTALYAIAYQIWVQPWINLWDNMLRKPVTAIWEWLKGVWNGIGKFFTDNVVKPIDNAWNGLMSMLRKPVSDAWSQIQSVWNGIGKFFTDNVVKPIDNAWNGLMKTIQNAMSDAANFFPKVFNGAVNAIKSVINGFLSVVGNAINSVVDNVNRLINAFNKLPGPDIPLVPYLNIPKFASGGMVDSPTLALVGEAGPEYIVPEQQMAAAARNYLAGARGAAVLQGGGSGSTGDVQISITTGPTIQAQGEQWVSVKDLERAMRITADGVLSRVRTPAARRALGIG